MNEPIFIKDDKYGFWKQQDPQPYNYSIEYKKHQSTNIDMCWLRLGWLANFLNPITFKDLVVCDIGSGNDVFVKNFNYMFKILTNYDIVGNSITIDQLYNTKWDLIFLTDVLEHFNNIEDLFKISWTYLFISFPETPITINNQQQLSLWKHYKPNEHIYCLNCLGMYQWFVDHNCQVVGTSNVEDVIRKPTKNYLINITTMMIINNN